MQQQTRPRKGDWEVRHEGVAWCFCARRRRDKKVLRGVVLRGTSATGTPQENRSLSRAQHLVRPRHGITPSP